MTSILTQNCWGSFENQETRFKTIADTIRKISPDIVCLQEVFFRGWQKAFENLDYHLSYKNGLIVIKGGLVTATKTPPKSSFFTKFDEQGSYFIKQWKDRSLGKGFLETTLEDDTAIINTHCVYHYDNESLYGFLEDQTIQLMDRVRELKKEDRQIILTGDLNLTKDRDIFKELTHLLKDGTKGLPRFNPYQHGPLPGDKNKQPLRDLIRCPQFDHILFRYGTLGLTSHIMHKSLLCTDHPGYLSQIIL